MSMSSGTRSLQQKGAAVWCIPPLSSTAGEEELSYFQGQLALPGREKAIAMLATEVPCDPCMACADGGYALFDLTLYPRSNGHDDVHVLVERTGGSLMKIRTKPHVEETLSEAAEAIDFSTTCIKTGDDALTLIRNSFRSIFEALADQDRAECIICIGTMHIATDLVRKLV